MMKQRLRLRIPDQAEQRRAAEDRDIGGGEKRIEARGMWEDNRTTFWCPGCQR